MRNLIIRLGFFGSVSVITFVSLVLSVVVTIVALHLANLPVTWVGMSVSIIVPLVVAPISSGFVVHTLFQIHELEGVMRSMATFDMLTGLFTRPMFIASSTSAHHTAMRNKTSLSLLSIDIDSFKKINDAFGHPAGDEVLKHFGDVIRQNTRRSDLSGRIGGEEFALILPDTDLAGSIYIANKIRLAAKTAVIHHGENAIRYTVSVGVAHTDHDANVKLEELMQISDQALYAAKNSGRDRVFVADRDRAIESSTDMPPPFSRDHTLH